MKMTQYKQKYIAEGFLEDVTNLVQEFIALETVEFREFSAIWRKHHFSLVFMGRPDPVETSEFVNEIYKITCQLLFTSSFHQQVGAVYTLYGLFRMQISDPIIKIRLEIDEWTMIKILRNEAISMEYLTLHYVIDYLIEHAFVYVASRTLKGPVTKIRPELKDDDEQLNKLQETYKSGILEYNATNQLAQLEELRKEYSDLTEKFGLLADNSNEKVSSFEIAIGELNDLVNFDKEKEESLGNKRAKLKVESFMRKSKSPSRMALKEIEAVIDDVDFRILEKPIRSKKQRRAPKEERKVGRPRKRPLKKLPEPKPEDEIDISHLVGQMELYNPLNDKKVRTKRGPYYEDPVKKECDSDDEDPGYHLE